MEDNSIWFFIFMPLAGYIIGSITRFRFLKTKSALKINLTCLALMIGSLLSGVSFYYDVLDSLWILTGLFFFGYIGTQLRKELNNSIKKIIHIYRILLIIFYTSLPLVAYSALIMAFDNDWIGSTRAVEEENTIRIKHVSKNSNFSFPGYHHVYVYKQLLIFEYPIDHFALGTFGNSGFVVYTVMGNKLIPSHKYEYDQDKKELIMKEYINNVYKKVKIIRHHN
jgi:hypothetical protein